VSLAVSLLLKKRKKALIEPIVDIQLFHKGMGTITGVSDPGVYPIVLVAGQKTLQRLKPLMESVY